MKKSAFTMLELVFVIVVVGILAAVFIPKFERDNAGEAAYQLARHIRLAQHHALVYDTFGTSKKYGIDINGTAKTYTVSDGQGGIVVDALTKKKLQNYDLKKNFGVSSVSGVNITFDHLGRPTPDANTTITLEANGVEAKVMVYQETGFVKVTSIDGVNIP